MSDHFHVKPLACDCPTAFFHSKFPTPASQILFSSSTAPEFKFNDVIYNKSNSAIFTLDTDGALLIKTGGTYFVDFCVDLNAISGIPTGAAFLAELQVESQTGFMPYHDQQLHIMFEPVAQEHIDLQRAWYHSSAVIHVGDLLYGVYSPQARVFVRLSGWGAFEYAPEMHITVRN